MKKLFLSIVMFTSVIAVSLGAAKAWAFFFPESLDYSVCDKNYDPCVPLADHDLDCNDIQFQVRVVGEDHNNFDLDQNGVGCERY